MQAQQLFMQARDKYGDRGVADKLGLNYNTVQRWVISNVPNNYLRDLLRLLGKNYEGQGTERDKDQFYTKPETGELCYRIFNRVAKKLGVSLSKYTFIEPSVGCGCFYDLLPNKKRIGIDIDPRMKDANIFNVITQDYLTWHPCKDGNYIVIGNPPFGLRGHLALQFINHSYDFADMVAFILPPLFNSDGKGVPGKRVKGYKLAYTENLPANSFQYPDGRDVDVAACFQVWTKIKTDKIKVAPIKSCKEYIRVYSLSDGGTPSSTRNKKMLYACDVYLPSTCFTGMHCYKAFEDLPHRRGYGVKVYKNKQEIKRLLLSSNWERIAFVSTNGALNLRTSLIENIVINAGHLDK